MTLPRGVAARDSENAPREWERAVGKEWVFTSEADLDPYRDSYSPFWHEPEDPIPSAALAPDSVEQVQQIIRTANTYRIPLWTVSTGKNLGYGGSAPRLSGSVPLGVPSLASFSSGGPRSQGHIDFTPMAGQAVFDALGVFDRTLREMGMTNVQRRSRRHPLPQVVLLSIHFPRRARCRKESEDRAAFRRLIEVGAEHGWGEYRTHTAFMDDAANTYAFNNHALRLQHETIKRRARSQRHPVAGQERHLTEEHEKS